MAAGCEAALFGIGGATPHQLTWIALGRHLVVVDLSCLVLHCICSLATKPFSLHLSQKLQAVVTADLSVLAM